MADLVLDPSSTIEVVRPLPPVFEVAPPATNAVLVLPLAGPRGSGGTGPAGPQGRPGQPRFSGTGPPPVALLGAEPGDEYLDRSNGDIYTLT